MDKNLNRWIDAIELLIQKYMMKFETTYNFDSRNVQDIVGLNHKIKDMFEAVEDYATAKGIFLGDYIKTYHKEKSISNFFATFYKKNDIGFAPNLRESQTPDPDDDSDFDK